MKSDLESRCSILPKLMVALLAAGVFPSSLHAAVFSSTRHQVGTILSVRKVLRSEPYPINVHPQIHYYDLFFSVRFSDQTYCAQYTTPVLEEIDDLFASSGRDIDVVLKKGKLIARIPKRHKMSAHLVNAKHCLEPSPAVQQALPQPTLFTRHPPSKPTSDLPKQVPGVMSERLARQPKSSLPEEVGGGTPVRDAEVTGYINRLVHDIALAADVQQPLSIEVLESEEVNAFVLGSRRLYVNAGLILTIDNEAELAGVLAHEIAHLTLQHERKIQRRRKIWRIASFCSGPAALPVEIAGFLSSMKSHRDAERQADWFALKYQDAAGYDPQAFLSFLEKAQTVEGDDYRFLAKAFATHPSAEDRVRRAQKEILTQLKPRAQYIVDTSEFEQMKLRLATLKHRPLEVDERLGQIGPASFRR